MKKITFLIFFLLPQILFSQSKINYQLLNANNIHLLLQNIGNMNYRNYANGGGIWKLIVRDTVIIFDQGPWIIGKINNKIHLAFEQWSGNYSPGPILNNIAAMQYKPEDSLKYRIYKISRGDDNSDKDYLEWPIEFGAPKTKDGKPKLFQDQMLWAVFNEYDPAFIYKYPWKDSLPQTPIEIQQLAYAKKGNSKDEVDIFSNIVFFEWTIINKGKFPIDSAYFSFWTDIDFGLNAIGGSGIREYNIPQIDSTSGLGYLWSNTTDPQPAVGYVMLYGPSVPANGAKAIYKGKERPHYKNLEVTSNDAFFGGGAGVPYRLSTSTAEAWNIARGLYTNGIVKTNPSENKPTKFTFSGDPVTNKGWIWNGTYTGGGAGFNLFSGPFNLAPNDTQWVMMALVPALGKDYKESITIMRNKVKLLKSLPYDSLAFGRKAVMVGVENRKDIPMQISLEQNYPNPFNPETTIEFSLPKEGRYVLGVFNILGERVKELADREFEAGYHEVSFDGSRFSSGVYFYCLRGDGVNLVKKMMLVK